MKRLVLLGEGRGEVSALPVLARRLLREKDPGRLLFVDDAIIRAGEAVGLVRWDAESHGKRWLEEHCPGYRPTRDQSPLTELLDFNVVRAKNLRSFARLEHAIDQLLEAVGRGAVISTP